MKKIFFTFFATIQIAYAQDVKISAMPTASDLSGTVWIPIVQGGINKKAAASLFESSFTANMPLVFSSNVLSIQQATTSQNGYLSNTDWNTFNGKISSSYFGSGWTSPLTASLGSGWATALGSAYVAPTTYSAGTGLTLSTNTFSVNTSQNISTLSNLTSNGLIKTSGGTGALSIATAGTDYVATETDPVAAAVNGWLKSNGTTLSAVTGTGYPKFSGTTPTFITAIQNGDLANSTISGIALGNNLANLTIGAELISGGSTTYNGGTAKTLGIQSASVTNAMLANSTITLNSGTNFGITAPGAMSLGSTYTIGTTSDNLRFNDLGLGVAAPSSGGQISQTLGANNITGHLIKRFTDTSPTGKFMDFQNAASSSLANLDISGNWTAQKFITSGGSSSQFVKGDGSLDGSTYLTGNQTITLSGDVTGSGTTAITTTLATVNSNIGPWGSATQAPQFTVNGKGLITAASNVTITPAVGSITGLGTGVATALGVNVGTAGSFVVNGGALGTPSSGTATNLTGLPLTTGVTGTLPIANGGTNNTSFTDGSVIFYNNTGTKFDQNNNNFYWNKSSALLSIGTAGDQSGTDVLNIYNQGDAYLPNSSQGSLTSSGATSGWTASSSRGTGASPSNLSANDLVGGFSTWGYTNSAYTPIAGAWGYVTGSTSTNLGGEYRIYTKADGGSLTQRFTLDNSGRAKIGVASSTGGGLDVIAVGTTTNKGINYTLNDGTTNVFNIQDNGTTTHTATLGTVSANNTYSWNNTTTATSRATTSDFLGGMNFVNTLTANAGSITLDGIVSDYTPIASGGVSTLNNGGASASQGSTLAGMTATTYTSVAPASTTGTGSGALFTVVVSNATTITSITQTTAGSGYKLYDGVTFNGSQFGSGSGSITFAINAITGSNSYTSQSAPFVAINRLQDLRGVTKAILSIRNANNTSELGNINVSYPVTESSLVPSINFSVQGTNYLSLGGSLSSVVISKNLSLGSNTFTVNGQSAHNGGLTFGLSMQSGGSLTNALANGAIGKFTTAGATEAQYQVQHGSLANGVVNTSALTAGGTGYSAGTLTTTGGTGSGATFTVTVSGGVVQTAVVSNRGTGYSNGDVLTLVGGGNNASVTLNASTGVDFASSIFAYNDNSSVTDAKSIYTYTSFNANPTYNITSTQVGTISAFDFIPTLTATGSFLKYGIRISATGFLSSFGAGSSPTALVHAGAATTSYASLRMASGTAPSSPNDGDHWYDGTNFYVRSTTTQAIATNVKQVAGTTTGTFTTTLTNTSAFTITPTGSCTFNASGGVAGQECSFVITTSGTSSFTLTWNTNFKSTGTLATGTVSGKVFTVTFIYDGANWNEQSRTTAM